MCFGLVFSGESGIDTTMKNRLFISALLVPFLSSVAAAQSDEIIVTATRQAESVRDYAGAIDVISETRLKEISAVHPAESLNGVAGVNIHRGSGQEHLTAIRSPVLTGGAGAGSFLYLEDGVPLRAAGFANVNGLFEAGTEFAGGLEVVKGPGSVLYGSNAVHGLVNVLSQDPDAAFGGSVRLLGSDDGLASFSGTITGATGEKSATRLSVSLVHDNGFREDSGFDQQKIQLRHDTQLGDWSARWLTTFQNLNQETAGFVQGDDAYLDPVLSSQNAFPEAFRDARSLRSQLRLNKELDGGQMLSLTPYGRWTDLEFLRHFVPGQALEENGHVSVGLLSTLYGEDYVLGFDAEYTDGFLDEFQFNPSRFSFIQGAHYDYEVKSLVLSAYGQREMVLGHKTTLTVGARADYTDYRFDNRIDSGTFGRFIRVDDRSDDFFTVTPKIGLTHDLSESATLYARAARGARAPQTADLYSLQLNQTVGDTNVETLDSLEVGYKGQLGLFAVEVAGFYMWKDNFFFRNANGFNVTDGETKHRGVEISFNGALTEWLSISGDATLAEHTYSFTDTVNSASSSITNGDQVDTAPNTLAHLRAIVTPNKTVRAELEWRHVGDYFTDPGNTRRYPGHDLFVLRGFFDVSESLTLFGRIDNLFDIRYADRADFAFGNERFFPGRPRTIFFGLTQDF